MKIVFLAILAGFSPFFLSGQVRTTEGDLLGYSYAEERQLLHIGLGFTRFNGDIRGANFPNQFGPALDFGYQFRVHKNITLRGELSALQLLGDDTFAPEGSFERDRNLMFRAWGLGANVSGLFHMFALNDRYYRRKIVNPYISVGVGGFYHHTQGQFEGDWVALRPLETEGTSYLPVTVMVPAGLGAKFRVSKYFNVSAEASYRFTFSDYIDDVSGTYRDPNSFEDPLASSLADRGGELSPSRAPFEEGSPRGNVDRSDHFWVFLLRLEYYWRY